MGKGRCVLAYALAEALKRAEDNGDEDGYKDNHMSRCNWRTVVTADGVSPWCHDGRTLAEKSDRPQRTCEVACVVGDV